MGLLSRKLIINGHLLTTPCFTLPTKLCTVPHLTRDIYDRVLDTSKCIMEVYYEDLYENLEALRRCPFGLKKYANLEGYCVWMALREDRYFLNPEGFEHINSDLKVSGLNHAGVIKMSLQEMGEMFKKAAVDALVAPVDHFRTKTQRRFEKSKKRTALYYEELKKTCPEIIKSVLYEPTLELEAPIVAVSALGKQEYNLASSESFVYLRGSMNLEDQIALLLQGKVDIIDASYLLEQSELGYMLSFTFDFTISWIDLKDPKYKADTSKLADGCKCPGCQFMKAYVHHLFVVKEMLGPAVLSAHNLFALTLLLQSIGASLD